MIPIAEQKKLMTTGLPQHGRQVVKMPDVESVVIAARHRQRLDGQHRRIPIGSPEDAGIGARVAWRLGESATPSRARPRYLTR
jgi:hypothetical protein